MQTCLVNLAFIDPPSNGGTSRIAHEVSSMLLDFARHDTQLSIVFAVRPSFCDNFDEWLGKLDSAAPHQIAPCGITPEDAQLLVDKYSPEFIVGPLFGCEPFQFVRSNACHIAMMPDTLSLDRPELFPLEESERRRALYDYLKSTQVLVTISEYSSKRLQHHLGLPPERLAVIPLGSDPVAFDTEDELSLAPVPHPFVFYPANIWPHKRHEFLFKVMKEIWKTRPELNLVLSGGRNLGFGAEVAEFIERHECPPERVIDLGYVTDRVLRSLYRDAEAMLFVSEHEGFGMPLVEAMKNGCPVICAPITSIPEVAGEAAFYIDSECPEVWAACFLNEFPRERKSLKQKGRARSALFTWERARDAWADVLRRAGLDLRKRQLRGQSAVSIATKAN